MIFFPLHAKRSETNDQKNERTQGFPYQKIKRYSKI